MPRYEAQTLGDVAKLVRDRHSHGLYAFCMNTDCPRRLQSVLLDLSHLIARFGKQKPLRDVLITCRVCARQGRDRTLTNLAIGMNAGISGQTQSDSFAVKRK